MSRLFLVVFVAGTLGLVGTASADVPNCDCLQSYCWVACPGAWGGTGHTPGSETDWEICLYQDQACTVPLVGDSATIRLDLSAVLPDSICVCEEECLTFPYVYPEAPTDINGCTSFRFRGSILDLSGTVKLQVSGCQDVPIYVRSPDVTADCDVSSADFAVFASAFVICPPDPTGLQHYTVYANHCAPCPAPGSADLAIFARHFGHNCLPKGSCDPL